MATSVKSKQSQQPSASSSETKASPLPKLSMKVLYQMSESLKLENDRLAARLAELESLLGLQKEARSPSVKRRVALPVPAKAAVTRPVGEAAIADAARETSAPAKALAVKSTGGTAYTMTASGAGAAAITDAVSETSAPAKALAVKSTGGAANTMTTSETSAVAKATAMSRISTAAKPIGGAADSDAPLRSTPSGHTERPAQEQAGTDSPARTRGAARGHGRMSEAAGAWLRLVFAPGAAQAQPTAAAQEAAAGRPAAGQAAGLLAAAAQAAEAIAASAQPAAHHAAALPHGPADGAELACASELARQGVAPLPTEAKASAAWGWTPRASRQRKLRGRGGWLGFASQLFHFRAKPQAAEPPGTAAKPETGRVLRPALNAQRGLVK